VPVEQPDKCKTLTLQIALMKNPGAKLRSIFVPSTKIINIGDGYYFIAFIPLSRAARYSGCQNKKLN